MKKKGFIALLQECAPGNLLISEQDIEEIKRILNDRKTRVFYLRDGFVVEEVFHPQFEPGMESTFVLRAGAPRAVLVSFVLDGKLYVGWAKRNEEITVVKNAAYKKLVQSLQRPVAADEIFRVVTQFVRSAETKELEVPFSKKLGKYLAVLWATRETIVVNGDRAESNRCKNIPILIAKELPQFVSRSEKFTGLKAENVKIL